IVNDGQQNGGESATKSKYKSSPTTTTPNNFAVAFRTLFRILASSIGNSKPVVVVFDDLHDLCQVDDVYDEHNLTTRSLQDGFTKLQPTKTKSSASTVLQLIQSLIVDIQNLPNVLTILSFQPVSQTHPLTAFLQQLEQTSLALQDKLQFFPIVPQNLSETAVYQWLQHAFCSGGSGSGGISANSNIISPSSLHQLSSRIIQTPILTGGGNPFCVKLLLDQVQAVMAEQQEEDEVDVQGALSVVQFKLERLEKLKRRPHGRRFSSGREEEKSTTSSHATTDDDPAMAVLVRHLSFVLDSKCKTPTSKRLCYLVATYCCGGTSRSMSMSTEKLRTAWKLFDGSGSSDGVNDAVADAVSSGMFQLLERQQASNKGKEFYLVFRCSVYRDVMYSQIMTSGDRLSYHAKLALSLYNKSNRDIFTAATHWQRGSDDLNGAEEQQRLVTLFLRAGHQAVEWSQFESACQFYAMGIKAQEYCFGISSAAPTSKGSMGGANAVAWTASPESYADSLELHLGVARACAYLNRVEDVNRYAKEILHHIKHSSSSKENSTKSTVEQARINAIQMQCFVQNQRYSDAIQLGRQTLSKLGERVLPNPKNGAADESEIKNTRKLLDSVLKAIKGSSIANKRLAATSIVESLAPAPDTKGLHAIQIYILLLTASFMEHASLISSISYRIVRLTLECGMCPASASGFTAMASVLYSSGDSEYGSLCEFISSEINTSFQDKASRGRNLVIQNTLTLPHRGFPQQLKVAYRLCNDVGDKEFAMFSTLVSVTDLLVAGGPLNATAEAMKGVYQVLTARNNQILLCVLRPLFQMALNLLGVESTRAAQETNHHEVHVLQGNIIASEDQEVAHARETGNVKAEFANYLAQATLSFHMNEFEMCRVAIEKLLASLNVQWFFLDAMSAICLLWRQSRGANSKAASKLKKKNVAIAEKCLKRLEVYASSSPDLVDQKVFMIKAELQVLSGQVVNALQLFGRAMEHCEGYDITSDRALACERAGLALRANHREDEALDYLEDSMTFYRQYGALAK
ncbi:MAG: hypothetical protein SGILL_008748, partial [Bacillariaceae sp.]